MNHKTTPYQNLSKASMFFVIALIVHLLSLSSVYGSTACSAEFTYSLDSTSTIPVFTFSALYPDDSKTYEWNIGGSQIRTGESIEHIFFDAGGWGVTLTVFDETDTCSTNQRVDVSQDTQAPQGSCFFNTWQNGNSTYAVESWMPWYWEGMSSTVSFDDGSSSIVSYEPVFGEHITHTYDSPGTYEICQTMNADDCSYCKEVTVRATYPECLQSFTYTIDSTSSSNWKYTFSVPDADSSKLYSWLFEDVRPAFGSVAKHTFMKGGSSKVFLFVMENGQTTCSSSQWVVAPSPSSCILNVGNFPSQSNDMDFYPWVDESLNNVYYTMDFGNGYSISDSQTKGGYLGSYANYYHKSGTYAACLNVTDSAGYECQTCEEIIIELPTCDNSFTHTLTDSRQTDSTTYLFKPGLFSGLYDYRWEVNGVVKSTDGEFGYTF